MVENLFEYIYNNERTGQTLIKDGVITEDQLKEALEVQKEQGGFLGKILVEKGILAEEEILSYFLEKYAIPYVPPSQFPINPESKKFIPEEIARKYLLLPVDHIGYRLSVICAGPLEGALLGQLLEACQGWPVSYFLSNIGEIEEAIERMYSGK
jgi:hypothetical protein